MSLRLLIVVAIGVVLVAAGSAAGSPQAVRSGNLVANGSFEQGPAGDGMELVDIPGWESQRYNPESKGDFTVVGYGAPTRVGLSPVAGDADFPARGATRASGRQFLFGGPQFGGYELRQRVDLSEYASLIDEGKAWALFSAEAVHTSDRFSISVHADFGPHRFAESLMRIDSVLTSAKPRMVDQTQRTNRIGRGVRSVDILVRFAAPMERPWWVRTYVDNIRFEITTDGKAKPTAGGEPAKPKLAPRIWLTPTAIARGKSGILRGTGWKPTQEADILLGTKTQKPEQISIAHTTAQGTFAWKVVPTAKADPGVYVLVVCQNDCKLRAQTTLIIR